MTISTHPSAFIQCVNRAIEFEPSLEMKRRLEKNKETFAQYVVRLLSYSCTTCNVLPGMPCTLKVWNCGVQFHRARARAARCPITKTFLEPELDDE